MLVVDDVPDNRELLRRCFEKRGYEVVEAESGTDALALIDGQRFDIVMLDIMMPGQSGIDTLKFIRQKFSPGKLPVIMVTSRGEIADVVEALEFGANDYLTKPVELTVAYARVTSQLERKRAQDAHERSVAKLASTVRQLECEILELRRADARLLHLARDRDACASPRKTAGVATP